MPFSHLRIGGGAASSYYVCIQGWPITCGTDPSFTGNESDYVNNVELFKVLCGPFVSAPLKNIHIHALKVNNYYVGAYTLAGVLIARWGPFISAVGHNIFNVSGGPNVIGPFWLGFTRQLSNDPAQDSSGGYCRYNFGIGAWNNAWTTPITPSCAASTWGDAIWAEF
jgi:hypothetical protein